MYNLCRTTKKLQAVTFSASTNSIFILWKLVDWYASYVKYNSYSMRTPSIKNDAPLFYGFCNLYSVVKSFALFSEKDEILMYAAVMGVVCWSVDTIHRHGTF